tara:strand:+ start:997 stop:1968 length:972 start_codon:yes stop_codon:yes gene_type:complete
MFNYSKYEKAPLIQTKNIQSPKNGQIFYYNASDNIKIRVGIWSPIITKKNKTARGTILLQQGHNEFIEKYFEVIQEFLDRGFYVICFDWRGQGMSGRMIKDKNKAFIKSFDLHDGDLNEVLTNIIKPFFPKPLIGIGHSMGGCLMLSAFHDHKNEFDLGVLSAPMLGFKNEKFLRSISSVMNFFKNDSDYLIGSSPNMGIEANFENNDLTTDSYRYKRTQELISKQPSLRLWGVTNAFAKAINERFKIIRRKGWAEEINLKILVFNNTKDRVVDASKINSIAERLVNKKIIIFSNTEHEIFMEQDIYRKRMWAEIDQLLSKNL